MRCDACRVENETVAWVVVRGRWRFTFCRKCRIRHGAVLVEVLI
jgi:hypothetical protein